MSGPDAAAPLEAYRAVYTQERENGKRAFVRVGSFCEQCHNFQLAIDDDPEAQTFQAEA